MMDALALRLEEEMYRCEGQHHEEVDKFDDLWFQLNDLFQEFSDHCDELGIHLYDVCCLSLPDKEYESESESEEMLNQE